MSTIVRESSVTPEDLLNMPDGDAYELVDGNLVERDTGAISSWVGGKLVRLLGNYLEEHDLGWVLSPDTGYQCFPDAPRKVRRPDASFIRYGRLEGERLPEGFVTIPPDLAVEVLSPNDLAYDIDRKLLEYLQVGVRLVWIINPNSRVVRIHRADGSCGWLNDRDTLDGEDLLPGFHAPVASLFPPDKSASPSS